MNRGEKEIDEYKKSRYHASFMEIVNGIQKLEVADGYSFSCNE